MPLRAPRIDSEGLSGPYWMQPSHKLFRRLRWALFWTSLIGGLDVWRNTKHDGSTISELLRELPPEVFLAGLLVLSIHILKKPTAPR